MDIGLIAMSGKPVTFGHWAMITSASKENDKVIVFVSTSDRTRKGEISILGSDMKLIWDKHLSRILPKNVTVEFGGIPVRKVYETIGTAETDGSEDVFSVYADKTDISNYANLQKYAPNLMKNNQIQFRSSEREIAGGESISGTRMRNWLALGKKKNFIEYLPKELSDDSKNDIWMILSKKMNESLMRTFIKQILNF